MKWCQVRVFLATCVGFVIGNVLARAVHGVPAYAVLPCGAAGWLAGNALNAFIAQRSENACGAIVPAANERVASRR